jgi:diaminohydroxyphosphoribosylaminopyrimidine deaminase/5-amino-6-(5-phosphoribosylamino)uracil reductase
MNQKATDVRFMRRSLQLAACGRLLSRPNPMVGAVIVHEGRILGEGYHVRCGEAHAEVNAFASVVPDDEPLLSKSTIYVSLEPCAHYGKTPPCADLIVKKGVKRVVVGCQDPFSEVQGRGIAKLRQAGIDVTLGVLEEECRWLNRRFFTFHSLHRPYIILKWAQSADGFLDDHGRAYAFSTPFTQMLVHRLRAREDAIVVGRVTDEREHPQLTVRRWAGPSPARFVLGNGYGIDQLLADCRERQLQSLIVEGGAQTLQSFIDRRLFDEVRIEKSPAVVAGGTKAPVLPSGLRLLKRQAVDGNEIIRLIQDSRIIVE